MKSVAIIGAGLVGRAWAIVFARAGWAVKAFEPDADVRRELPGRLCAMAEELSRYGLIENPKMVVANIIVADRLEVALAGVDFVQENGPERVEVKQAIFADLDRLAPKDAILASSSSAIVASRFSEGLAGRARCLVGHPVNPPHLVPVVEICGAPWTSKDAIEQARSVYESIGQTPVMIHREVEGFVLNRLQSVVLAEALRLVAEGIVSPQDLDHTMKDGLGLRWAFMGPFETIELNAPDGMADYLRRYGPAFGRIASTPADPTVWEQPNVDRLVAAWGKPGREALKEKMDWRDRTLAALVAHKKTSARPPH